MMRKLYNLLAIGSITVTLALMGLVAAAAVTGKLTDEHLSLLAAVFRDEPADAEPDAAAPAEPAESASAPAAGNPADLEVLQRLLDRRQRELEYQTEQLHQLRRLIAQEREDLRQARVVFHEQTTTARQHEQDEGFREQVRLYESLQPRQVKDILMGLSADEAARTLRAMNRRAAGKVIGQFRTPPEQDHLQNVLTLMQAG